MPTLKEMALAGTKPARRDALSPCLVRKVLVCFYADCMAEVDVPRSIVLEIPAGYHLYDDSPDEPNPFPELRKRVSEAYCGKLFYESEKAAYTPQYVHIVACTKLDVL